MLWDANCDQVTEPAARPTSEVRQVFEDGRGTGFATLHSDGVVRFWRIDGGRILSTVGTIQNVRAAQVSPKGRYLVMYSASGELRYLDLLARLREQASTKKVRIAGAPELRANDAPPALFISPQEDRIGVVFENTQAFVSTRVGDVFGDAVMLATGSTKTSDIKRIYFDSKGSLLATVHTDGRATLWGKSGGSLIRRESFDSELTQCFGSGNSNSSLWEAAAFSEDNSELALERRDGMMRVYDLDLQGAAPNSSQQDQDQDPLEEIEELHLQTLSTKQAKGCRSARNTQACWEDFNKVWLGAAPNANYKAARQFTTDVARIGAVTRRSDR
jgi:WD40 repeat protein